MVAQRQPALPGQAKGDLDRMLSGRGLQAYCLECPETPNAKVAQQQPQSWLARAFASAIE
jgi:protease-4